ncbi:MAG TPA: GspH/FimT family pseudopilin [Burkholderiaceae bacterium]|nr:GspH/FimT family pseudopilin [Burkholderiaceae bacterium]
MAVLLIASALLMVALPGLSNFAREQRLRAAAFDLIGDLLLARSESIKRAADVTIASQGGDWRNGWRVTVAGGFDNGLALQQRAGIGPQIDVAATAQSLTFDRNGRLRGGGDAQLALNDVVRRETRRCIRIELSGNPISQPGACQ